MFVQELGESVAQLDTSVALAHVRWARSGEVERYLRGVWLNIRYIFAHQRSCASRKYHEIII